MEIIRTTPKFTLMITDVVPAENPDDGGKWAILCQHLNQISGEWFNGGIVQDTNKKRLAEWRKAVIGAGYCVWCPACQSAHEEEMQQG